MYRINNRGDATELLLYDDIGEGWFGGISSKQVIADIEGIESPSINVRINSPGGDVFEGFAIYNALVRHPAAIEVDIDALAASVASVIAMAGDDIRMADNAMLMIHNPWTIAAGDATEMERTASLLNQIRDNIVATYQKQTDKRNAAEIQTAMDAETWYTASEAMDAGLIDGVTSERQMAAAIFDPRRFRNTPERFNFTSSPPANNPWRREAARRKLALTHARHRVNNT